MSYTKNEDGSITEKDPNATLMDKVINGVFMPFADANTLHTSAEVMACAGVYAGAGLVGGAVIGRRRAEAGAEPIFGVI